MQGHGGAGFGAKFMGPHAGAVDHRVSAHHALRRAHADGTAVFHQNLLDLGVLENTGAAALGPFGQGLCRVNRVGAAILGQEHATHQVAGVHARPELADFAGGQGLHLQPKALGHRRAAKQLFHPGGMGGHGHRASLAEAGGLPGFLLQRGVERGGVLRQSRQVVRGAQLADQPRRMPGGATGQLLAFQQHHVGAASQGQVVGDAAAHNAAADNHHLRPIWQVHGITFRLKKLHQIIRL